MGCVDMMCVCVDMCVMYLANRSLERLSMAGSRML